MHITGSEYGESVTVVACANAVGAGAIPPMILYKGTRMKHEFADDLPPGSVCQMTEKGFITTKSFADWLHQAPAYLFLMVHRATLIMRLWKLQKSTKFRCTAFPQNTTHELQPLDTAVFTSYEYHWDHEVMLHWNNHNERSITKQRFGKIWDKSVTPSNIKSGFQGTDIYPFDPSAIPEEAFAPSIATATSYPQNSEQGTSIPQPSTSGEESQIRARFLSSEKSKPVEDAILDSEDENGKFTTFTDLLQTHKKKTIGLVNRKLAINSRALVLKKTIFPR
jgi:hypothetical protein